MWNLLDFLFPRRCLSCGKPGFYICSKCQLKIQWANNQICPVCERPAIGGATHPRCQTRYSLNGLTSFWVYEGIIKKAIKDLKYRLVSDLAKELIFLLRLNDSSIFQHIDKDTVLVPVPLHKSRFNWRGFNQAEILGKNLAEKLKIQFFPEFLLRTRATKPQVELKEKERRENIKNAFIVNPKFSDFPSGRRFIIFDDVWTTGATLRTCGTILKRAGVKTVWGLTIAR